MQFGNRLVGPDGAYHFMPVRTVATRSVPKVITLG